MISVTDLAVAAGLLEGEGAVYLNPITKRNKGALLVRVSNTDREIIDWLDGRWPGSVYAMRRPTPRHQQAWVWTLAARKALAFLEEIKPYCITERMAERISAARWWQEIKSKHWRYRGEDDYAEQFACYHWFRELNIRGVPA